MRSVIFAIHAFAATLLGYTACSLLVAAFAQSEDGCGEDADVEKAHGKASELSGCARFAAKDRFMWIAGHTHCAHAAGKRGFLVAGSGMDGCG